MDTPLKTELDARGWSVKDLARESTVPYATCWRAVAGQGVIRRRTRLLIAGALGVPMSSLFDNDPNNDDGPAT